MTLIHHDGSALHVPNQEPALGDQVSVWLRTSPEVTRVHVRSTRDGEPCFVEAHPDRRPGWAGGPEGSGGPAGTDRSAEIWWRAEVSLHNPLTRYRFLVEDGTGPYRWYTARGSHPHEVPDDADFRLVSYPAPAPWTRDAVIYQIFPDRFARSAAAGSLHTPDRPAPDWAIPCDWDEPVIGRGPETPRQFYGGDLDGITERLDHIQALGADTVYLTPIFPGRSNHRYDASTFDHVDPLLGGDAGLRRLADALHARGMRLLGDITTNHTGDAHEWFRDPTRRDFYYFDPDGGYEAWYGIASLPKLNWNSAALRERFASDPDSVLRRWLCTADGRALLDGWRVDVANMTGRRGTDDLAHEVSRLVAQAVRGASPGALLVAEHNYSAGPDLDLDGWQGAMNYAGFLRPVWTWLRADDLVVENFLGVPGNIPRRDGTALVASMVSALSTMSWRSWTHSWTLLGTHDSARIRTIVGDPARVEVAAGLLATLPGTPMIFAGDEIGLTGDNGEGARRTMPWHAPERWDGATLGRYRGLLRLRRDQPALRHGGLRFAHVSADAVAYWRESTEGRLLVLARRAAGAPIPLPGVTGATNLYGGAEFAGTLPGDGPTFQVWACD